MTATVRLPLEGLVVLDFSQFLAGPLASLRFADWGARVIKIERPDSGEAGRQLVLANQYFDQDSLLFHTLNRNKESLAVNLQDPRQRECVKNLVAHADVLIQSFRPGVMEKYGLDYPRAKELNPRLVYGSISGYGAIGPWRSKPGQDLLVQALSGLTWLTGNADQPPTPMGLSVIDTLTGSHLAEGILACLVRRGITNQGGLVEVSLLESALDFQLEVLTSYLNGGTAPQRSSIAGAHPYLPAPYGVYETADGYLALAMNPLERLAELLHLPELKRYRSADAFRCRDEIKRLLAEVLRCQSTQHWLAILEPAGIWCAEIFSWERLLGHEAFQAVDMLQTVTKEGSQFRTTRCPVRIDGVPMRSPRAAPRLGEHAELPGE